LLRITELTQVVLSDMDVLGRGEGLPLSPEAYDGKRVDSVKMQQFRAWAAFSFCREAKGWQSTTADATLR
jgi:adenylosuccinate synthase